MSMRLITLWYNFTYCVMRGTSLLGLVRLFNDRPPYGFRSAVVDALVPRQHPASDHLASQRRAIMMVQLEDGVDLRLAVANTRFKETDQPFKNSQSFLVADRDFQQTISVDKVVENFLLRAAGTARGCQPCDIVPAKNGAADLSEYLLVQPVPAEIAVGAQSDEIELLQYREMVRDGRLLQFEHRRELLNAVLGGREQADHLEAALIGHRLAELKHHFRLSRIHRWWLNYFDVYLIRYVSKYFKQSKRSLTSAKHRNVRFIHSSSTSR